MLNFCSEFQGGWEVKAIALFESSFVCRYNFGTLLHCLVAPPYLHPRIHSEIRWLSRRWRSWHSSTRPRPIYYRHWPPQLQSCRACPSGFFKPRRWFGNFWSPHNSTTKCKVCNGFYNGFATVAFFLPIVLQWLMNICAKILQCFCNKLSIAFLQWIMIPLLAKVVTILKFNFNIFKYVLQWIWYCKQIVLCVFMVLPQWLHGTYNNRLNNQTLQQRKSIFKCPPNGLVFIRKYSYI
jgi:hypothetical protein